MKVCSKGGVAQVDRVLYNATDKDSSSRRDVAPFFRCHSKFLEEEEKKDYVLTGGYQPECGGSSYPVSFLSSPLLSFPFSRHSQTTLYLVMMPG